MNLRTWIKNESQNCQWLEENYLTKVEGLKGWDNWQGTYCWLERHIDVSEFEVREICVATKSSKQMRCCLRDDLGEYARTKNK